MLLERDWTVALTVDEKVSWSRPSIDVLLESAAHAVGSGTVAVLLTGSNHDGVRGMKLVRKLGGLTIAQAPHTAEAPEMPAAAIEADAVDKVLPVPDIAAELDRLHQLHSSENRPRVPDQWGGCT